MRYQHRIRAVLVALVAAALAGFYVAIPAYRIWQATRLPNLLRLDDPPATTPPGYRDVTLATSDGLVLRGWYRPSANGAAVVLTHGFALDRAFLMPQAEILAAEGFGVLTYDLRAHGASDGTVCTRGWRETDDVLAAGWPADPRNTPGGSWRISGRGWRRGDGREGAMAGGGQPQGLPLHRCTRHSRVRAARVAALPLAVPRPPA